MIDQTINQSSWTVRKNSLFNSLRFQVTAVLLLIVSLFGGTVWFTLYALSERQYDAIVLKLASQLTLAEQQMAAQALNYLENAPRDYESYSRDVNFFYRDLLQHIETFDRITKAFMMGDLPPELTEMDDMMEPVMDDSAIAAMNRLEETWKTYRAGLFKALGDEHNPRLEYAAEHIVAARFLLQRDTEDMLTAFETAVSNHLERIQLFQYLVLIVAFLLALMAVYWLHRYSLRPMQSMVEGFERVAQGDFGYQLPSNIGSTEMTRITKSFNHLSTRLHALFDLLEQVQKGDKIDETLSFIRNAFSPILSMSWIGVMQRKGDQLKLLGNNGHDTIRFSSENNLLKQVLEDNQPIYIANIAEEAQKPYRPFMQYLHKQGLNSAALLPMKGDSNEQGVLAFASLREDAYTKDQRDLLANITHLVTHSFARTLQLIERARLAAIGEFASGIVHEVRNPLTTITLAINHFEKMNFDGDDAEWVNLAKREATRMKTLLEDVLTQASPIELHRERLNLNAILERFVHDHQPLCEAKSQRITLECSAAIDAYVDADRLQQVLLNLLQNACDAAPENSTIRCSLKQSTQHLELSVHNIGEPIPADLLPRITEPFVSTKPKGTGLGLSLVARIVESHGGELKIISNQTLGTIFTVQLPKPE